MEMKKPKPKKVSLPEGKSKLPLRGEREIVGVFNGHSVTVSDLDSMNYLYESGNFGKGTLSKGEPNYYTKKDDIPKIILQHQFENQSVWNASTSHSCSQTCRDTVRSDFKLSLESVNSFLQSSFKSSEEDSWKSWKEKQAQKCQNQNVAYMGSNDSEKTGFSEYKSDETDYKDDNFISIVDSILQLKQMRKPKDMSAQTEDVIVLNASFNPDASDLSVVDANARFEKLPFTPAENLSLGLEESFFLKSVLGCLRIVDLDFSEISTSDLWEKFNSVNSNFLERYLVYHYYRSKGWVVRSGLKFGGDYLLYKDGPAYYHASYLVKVLEKSKKLTWREFLSMNRLVETYNKDLVLCDVLPTGTSDNKTFPDVFKNYAVQEILVRRWFPTRERFSKPDEALS